MPRKFIKQFTPTREHFLKVIHHLLDDQALWHLHRRNAAKACAVGLFICYIPIPFQMLIAAFIAILLRINLPISVMLVWVTNPFTMPPLFYLAYKIGTIVMGTTPITEKLSLFELDFWITQTSQIWQPFLLGCLICGATLAFLGYWTSRLLWHGWILYKWKHRQKERKLTAQQ